MPRRGRASAPTGRTPRDTSSASTTRWALMSDPLPGIGQRRDHPPLHFPHDRRPSKPIPVKPRPRRTAVEGSGTDEIVAVNDPRPPVSGVTWPDEATAKLL